MSVLCSRGSVMVHLGFEIGCERYSINTIHSIILYMQHIAFYEDSSCILHSLCAEAVEMVWLTMLCLH